MLSKGYHKAVIHFLHKRNLPNGCVMIRPAGGRNCRRTCFFPPSIKERKKEERLLANSFGQVTFAFPTLDNLDNLTPKMPMTTQETNPVYWAYTHCLTLEPRQLSFSTFILAV